MREPSLRPYRKSPRIPGFDYATAGIYFLTICTHHMTCRVGEVREGQMHLKQCGWHGR
jgi:putative transposase